MALFHWGSFDSCQGNITQQRQEAGVSGAPRGHQTLALLQPSSNRKRGSQEGISHKGKVHSFTINIVKNWLPTKEKNIYLCWPPTGAQRKDVAVQQKYTPPKKKNPPPTIFTNRLRCEGLHFVFIHTAFCLWNLVPILISSVPVNSYVNMESNIQKEMWQRRIL